MRYHVLTLLELGGVLALPQTPPQGAAPQGAPAPSAAAPKAAPPSAAGGLGNLAGLLGGLGGAGGGAPAAGGLAGLLGGGAGGGGLAGLLGGLGGGAPNSGGLAGLFGGAGGKGGLGSMMPAGGSGFNPFTLLGTYLNGSDPASAATLASITKLTGSDVSQGITAAVCETFKPGNTMGQIIGSIFGSPYGKGPDEQCMVDRSGGSGPYPANYTEDPSLPYHTIYVPKQKPKEKMPVIIWANGFCMSAGTMFSNFHNEIASHGFMIVANGQVKGGVTGFTTDKELIKSIDWVTTNPAAKQWGDIDTSKLVVAGQSCGGEEAYAASKDPRVKLTALFNSPVFGATSPKTLKNPIAYFLGGPADMAQAMGESHWNQIPDNIPALQATNPIGHIGSYYQKNGGKTGRVAVSFFKWQLKGVESEKAQFCGPAGSSALMKEGSVFKSKNGFC